MRWNALGAYALSVKAIGWQCARSSVGAGSLFPRNIYIYYVIFTAILSQQFCCAQQWISVRSSQTEILTSSNEREARAALQAFEKVQQFFSSETLFSVTLNQPVRVFAFQSKEEYAPYRLNSNAFGHFLHTEAGDYIVLEDIKQEHYEAALHEYTHYVMKQAGLNLPTWLNEGLADLYSSLESSGQKAVIGRLLPGRMAVLEGRPSIDLRALFAVTPDSPYYKEGNKLLVFYAQSWSLAHMLTLDQRYSAQFPDFLKIVSSGVPSPDALLRVYGKSLEQIASDLSQYGPRMAANTRSFDIQLGNGPFQPEIKVLPNSEKELALADLLAAHAATALRALRKLAELAKQDPGNPLIEEKLGYAAWNMSQVDDARNYFARAVEHGSRNSEMIYRYAVMQKQAGAPNKEVIRLFERVLELSPDLDDARFYLGLLQFNEKKFSAASQLLSKLKAVKEEWNYAYYSALAYCDIEFSNVEEARIFGERARRNAKTSLEQSQADRLLIYLQTRTSATHGGAMLASAQQIGGKCAQTF